MSRIAKKQVTRDNTEGDSLETYYRRVFAIPFIDKLIRELELRSTKLSHSAFIFNTNCYYQSTTGQRFILTNH